MAITTPSMGLKRWDQPNDIFSYTELSDNFNLIDLHDHSSGKGVQIGSAGLANLAVTNTKLGNLAVTDGKVNDVSGTKLATGTVAETKLTTGLAGILGATSGATIRRGKSIVATAESRTNVAYGLLTTPDRVQSIVLPTDGLIFIAYQALWKSSGSGTGSADIFLGATSVAAYVGSSSSLSTGAVSTSSAGAVADRYEVLSTYGSGLAVSAHSAADKVSPATTGQYVAATAGVAGVGFGTAAIVFAAAGTYDVSIQFKATSGSVTAKDRKLWVWTLGF